MPINFALTVEYDGTAYHGWQLQENASTVQGVLLDAIERVTETRPTIYASGRTDAGVHALGQVVNFELDTRLDSDDLQRALNSNLPRDIVVKRAKKVPPDFHAQHSTVGKQYKYVILNREFPSALLRHYTWHVRFPLDVPAMREGARHLVGRHDFSAFWGGDGDDPRDAVRTVAQLTISQAGESVEIRVRADGFLRYMVRNITGTLADVGRMKITPRRVKEILESRDRKQAGPTAPPHGLFLVEVFY